MNPYALITVACYIILAHLAYLMRVRFCVWCVKCAKYLAFDTFERTDENTLIPFNPIVKKKKKKVIIIRKLFYEDANRTRIKKGHATDILQSVEWRPHTKLQML